MIPGVGGTLLSSGYLAGQAQTLASARTGEFRTWARQMTRCCQRTERALGPASSPRAVLDVAARPIVELLGYTLSQVEPHAWGHAGILAAGGSGRAVLLCAPWGTPLDAAWRFALRASLAARLPWALVVNGRDVAIVDGTQPWARRLVSFDLRIGCRDGRALQLLWHLARAASLHAGDGRSTLADAVAASDRHGAGVCSALGAGVLDALQALVGAFQPNRSSGAAGAFDQALTIVYRLLFLFFAEARLLVPARHPVYWDAYSLEALVRRVMTRPGARGTWATLQAMSRLAHAGCRAGDLQVTAFNGRLFAPDRTPLAEHGHVPDASAARALLSLGTAPGPRGRERIAFHDLGVEQLGSVYERVLDYEPARGGRGWSLRPTSTTRKTTGSFYTPRSITDFLVRRTLGPLVDGRSPREILELRIIDPAMGSGAFLVAACRYLGERLELADGAEGRWADDGDRHARLRTIAERCLYGIDRNATAVHLARLSLWLTTLASDRPLTFLDHHLATGNSLVGARLADLSRPPHRRGAGGETGDRQLPLFDEAALSALAGTVVPDRCRLALDPSTTAAEVREKERRLDRLLTAGGALARWGRAADLWTGLALEGRPTPRSHYAEWQRHMAGLATSLSARHCEESCGRAVALARAHAALHWELTFPEVFIDADGQTRPDAGFDAVVGNPPWEMMRADTGDANQRADARRRAREVTGFVRGSGHYRFQGGGHLNQYQLFLERALHYLRPGGRFGLILPGGIQSDVGSADLRRALLDTCRLDTWLAFDNRHAIFPVHRGIRFVVLTGATAGRTDALPLSCGMSDPAVLHGLPDDPRLDAPSPARVRIPRPMLERWDPAGLTIPAASSALDARVVMRALEAPALAAPGGWHVTFGRELNATDDRAHFCARRPDDAAPGPAAGRLPVVDGRHLRPFGVGLNRVSRAIDANAAARLLGGRSRFDHPRVCYRDVASATNRLTLIAALLPAFVVSTHTVFCARREFAGDQAWCLVGLLNSLVANYLVRLQMHTHVTAALMARLPVPRPRADSPEGRTLAALARHLAGRPAVDEDLDAYARLHAVAARLYGLTVEETRHVASAFPLLPEDLPRRIASAMEAADLLSGHLPRH